MHPGHNGHGRRRGRSAADAGGFIVTGFAAVFTAVSFLLTVLVGGAGVNDAEATDDVLSPGTQWQFVVLLAFAAMSAGLLLIMHGMRARDHAGPPIFAGRVADAAAGVLWDGGGPERLLPVLIILVCSVLEAWFDFF